MHTSLAIKVPAMSSLRPTIFRRDSRRVIPENPPRRLLSSDKPFQKRDHSRAAPASEDLSPTRPRTPRKQYKPYLLHSSARKRYVSTEMPQLLYRANASQRATIHRDSVFSSSRTPKTIRFDNWCQQNPLEDTANIHDELKNTNELVACLRDELTLAQITHDGIKHDLQNATADIVALRAEFTKAQHAAVANATDVARPAALREIASSVESEAEPCYCGGQVCCEVSDKLWDLRAELDIARQDIRDLQSWRKS